MTTRGSHTWTNSRLSRVQECGVRHDFEYREGYRPTRDPWKLRWGNLIHAALEAHAHGRAPDWDALGFEWDTDGVQLLQAQEVFRGYVDRWGGWDDVLLVEQAFECELVHPATFEAHPTWRMAGKVDLITGTPDAAVVWDHKTTGYDPSPGTAFSMRLAIDSQISHYMIGVESLGIHAARWIHDIIRRPEIEPQSATPIEKRKYCKTGPRKGELHARQRDRDESPEEYRERLRADIASRPDWYFHRIEVARITSQLADHLLGLWNETDRLEAAPPTKNTQACFRYGECPFWACCSTGTTPDEHPGTYVKVDDVHPELNQEKAHANR